eukprot:TRINITY_DN1791_c0_g1_i1.p1 TRINITY_DN1791_c0_g1~~TRINITY_DN1791_c0_g1_i1.p1  ORF type:complete len:969 (+),score=109.98 TRINITY_DN1791_c0_g1_i1:1691-4597(+)
MQIILLLLCAAFVRSKILYITHNYTLVYLENEFEIFVPDSVLSIQNKITSLGNVVEVVSADPSYTITLAQLASQNSSLNVRILSLPNQEPTNMQFVTAINWVGYAGGVVSGYVTKTRKICFLGDESYFSQEPFELGVRSQCNNCTVYGFMGGTSNFLQIMSFILQSSVDILFVSSPAIAKAILAVALSSNTSSCSGLRVVTSGEIPSLGPQTAGESCVISNVRLNTSTFARWVLESPFKAGAVVPPLNKSWIVNECISCDSPAQYQAWVKETAFVRSISSSPGEVPPNNSFAKIPTNTYGPAKPDGTSYQIIVRSYLNKTTIYYINTDTPKHLYWYSPRYQTSGFMTQISDTPQAIISTGASDDSTTYVLSSSNSDVWQIVTTPQVEPPVWKKPGSSVNYPPVIRGMCLSFMMSASNLILTGGVTSSGLYSSQMWRWTSAAGWIRDSSSLPTGIAYHGCASVQDGTTETLLLFGGLSSDGPGNTLFLYSQKSSTWTSKSASAPAPRFAFVTASLGGRLYIFGGKSGSTALTDAWVLYFPSLTWYMLPVSLPPISNISGGLAQTAEGVQIFLADSNGQLWGYSLPIPTCAMPYSLSESGLLCEILTHPSPSGTKGTTSAWTWWAILLISLGCVIVIVAVLLTVYRRRRKRMIVTGLPPIINQSEQWTVSSKMLGRGTYGKVYEGMDSCGHKVAVKVIEAVGCPPELDLLRKLSHPNVIRYLGHFERNGLLHIVLEYASGGSVLGILTTYGSLPLPAIVKYTTEALLGLNFLHRHEIIHRDIKPANLLVHDGVVKVSDLGEAKYVAHDGTQTVCGTACYMAPEVVHGRCQQASDIWSMGATVLHMLSSEAPQWDNCPATSPLVFARLAQNERPVIPQTLPALAYGFVDSCLQIVPASRPTCRELLEHKFLSTTVPDNRTIHTPGTTSSTLPLVAEWGRTLSGNFAAASGNFAVSIGGLTPRDTVRQNSTQ